MMVGMVAFMHSMTGFGRGTAATSEWHAGVEVGTVNRKQAEVVVNLPREIAGLEVKVRQAVLAAVSRGRAQVTVRLEAAGGGAEVRLDRGLALALRKAFGELEELVGEPLVPVAGDYLRMPGVLSAAVRQISEEEAWQAVEPALRDALAAMCAMRAAEGAHLRDDIDLRLGELSALTSKIAVIAPGRLPRQRDLMEKRLRDSGVPMDLGDERFLRELALFADRCDITEELTRLASHAVKFREYLGSAEAPGRALDFLCQEIFREFNTIGSKANDAEIAQLVVEAKTGLEQIREQIQNIE